MGYVSVENRSLVADEGFPGVLPGTVYGLATYGVSAYGQAPMFPALRSWTEVGA